MEKSRITVLPCNWSSVGILWWKGARPHQLDWLSFISQVQAFLLAGPSSDWCLSQRFRHSTLPVLLLILEIRILTISSPSSWWRGKCGLITNQSFVCFGIYLVNELFQYSFRKSGFCLVDHYLDTVTWNLSGSTVVWVCSSSAGLPSAVLLQSERSWHLPRRNKCQYTHFDENHIG